MKIDIARFSSIKIGHPVEVEVISSCGFETDGFFVMGNASNLLVAPSPPLIAVLDKSFDHLRLEGEMLIIGGKTLSGKIVNFCKKHDLGGLEFLSGLPGTLGGMIKMNAGLKERAIFDCVRWIDLGKGAVAAENVAHGYRFAAIDGVIFEAGLELRHGFDHALEAEFLAVRAKQPKEPSAGSCFKNPDGDYAGRLIEAVGLKGFRRGGAAFSAQHANFLINCGGAKFGDALWLINEAKRRVGEEFGVVLEEEIIVLGTEFA